MSAKESLTDHAILFRLEVFKIAAKATVLYARVTGVVAMPREGTESMPLWRAARDRVMNLDSEVMLALQSVRALITVLASRSTSRILRFR
jgi:hypothetical protein